MHENRVGWRGVLIRDLMIFNLKLVIDGLKDLGLMQIAIVAAAADLLMDKQPPRYFYKVMRLSERFDLWLNLHGASIGAENDGDGLFGRSRAGSNTLLGKLEELVRGPEGRQSRAA